MFSRYYFSKLSDLLKPNKVLVIYGPRQAGKTTLVKKFLQTCPYRYRFESGEDIRFREILSSESVKELRDFAEGQELLVIDEAQKVPNVGLGLKLLVDHVEGIKIIATGSASFDLANKIGEPLTGRKNTRILYPMAQLELGIDFKKYDLQRDLEDYLIFGSYPEVLSLQSRSEKIDYLNELVGSYLLKDILEMERVKSPKLLLNLLKLIAFQLGKDVSLSELAGSLGIDYKTVARYLDLLEKSFVITSVSGFSRNLRKEISKNNRYFFLDVGIRNAIISNFNRLDLRDDIGALWENFVIIERVKRNHYLRDYKNLYFWRTYDRQEIDLIEESGGQLAGFECKYRKDKVSPPKDFIKTYPQSSFTVINRDNYLDFLIE